MPKSICIPENHSKRRETVYAFESWSKSSQIDLKKKKEIVDEVARRRVPIIIAKSAVSRKDDDDQNQIKTMKGTDVLPR